MNIEINWPNECSREKMKNNYELYAVIICVPVRVRLFLLSLSVCLS